MSSAPATEQIAGASDARKVSVAQILVYELRVRDAPLRITWRVVLRIDDDALVIGDVFAKKTPQTPQTVITACRLRFAQYDASAQGD